MKKSGNKIDIAIFNSDIKLLKAGKIVHWSTRINGKLYKINATYHNELKNKEACTRCMYYIGQKCGLRKCFLS